MRSILLHFEPGSTRITGFHCSNCDWFHVFETFEADGTLPRSEVDLAHARFADHRCDDFPRVRVWDDAP